MSAQEAMELPASPLGAISDIAIQSTGVSGTGAPQCCAVAVADCAVLLLTVSVQGCGCGLERGTRECSGSRCTVWSVRLSELYAAVGV